MSQSDTPTVPAVETPPADVPVSPPTVVPEAPATSEPPVHKQESADRLGTLETMVSNLAESVTSLLDAVTSPDEAKPVSRPWTAWGTHPKDEK